MVPNSYENGISGIDKVIVKGALTSNDKDLLKIIFDSYIIKDTPLTISLNEKQVLIFQEDKNYLVEIFCKCTNNEEFIYSIPIKFRIYFTRFSMSSPLNY